VRVLLVLLASALFLFGQEKEEPIAMTTDRPGFRNSASLVGANVAQLENGLRLSTERELSITSEVRVGVARWLELRLVGDEIVLRSPSSTHVAGSSDLQPGIKVPLLGSQARKTRIAAILESRVPSGHSSQRTGGFEPGAELIWEHDLNDNASFGGTWNMTHLKQDRVWQRAASFSSQYSPSDRWGTFGEIYIVTQLEGGNQWAVNGGVTRSFGTVVMVDASAGDTIHGTRDWFIMVGLSIRRSLATHLHAAAPKASLR
jgi:hypothetical protein